MKKTKLVSRNESYDIAIHRPSKWGNPFATRHSKFATYKCDSVAEAVGCFARWAQTRFTPEALAELRGYRLACFCSPNSLCHGQVLIALAEGQSIEKFINLVSDERYAEILAIGMI